MCLSCNGGIRDWTTLNKEFRDNSMFIGLISGISTEMKSLSKDMTVKKKKARKRSMFQGRDEICLTYSLLSRARLVIDPSFLCPKHLT